MSITKNTSNHNVVRPEWAVILRPFFTTLNNYIMEERDGKIRQIIFKYKI